MLARFERDDGRYRSLRRLFYVSHSFPLFCSFFFRAQFFPLPPTPLSPLIPLSPPFLSIPIRQRTSNCIRTTRTRRKSIAGKKLSYSRVSFLLFSLDSIRIFRVNTRASSGEDIKPLSFEIIDISVEGNWGVCRGERFGQALEFVLRKSKRRRVRKIEKEKEKKGRRKAVKK